MLLNPGRILQAAIKKHPSINKKYTSARLSDKQLEIFIDQREWDTLRQSVRKRLRVFHGGISKIEKIRRKRLAKSIIRLMKLGKKKKRHPPFHTKVLSAKKKESDLLSAFFPDRDKVWKNALRRKYTSAEIDVKNFSLIDHPANTISTLQAIAKSEAIDTVIQINFLDDFCSDVSPYLIFGLMRHYMAPFISGGKISPAVTGMVDAVDLSKFLSIKNIQRRQESPTFFSYPVKYRRGSGSSISTSTAFEPSTADKVGDGLVDKVDSWLQNLAGKKLSREGKGQIYRLIGEILNNAERHSDLIKKDGDWAVAAFLSAHKDENKNMIKPYCSISVVSLGATIPDSINRCEDPLMKANMDQYIELHHNNSSIPKDCLAAVFALQDGISRFAQDDAGEKNRGGIGMMEMIKFVGELGMFGPDDEPPAITILSGHACLHIRDEHFSRVLACPPLEQRQVWFNGDNDVARPPDTQYVQSLPVEFPGTAVAIRFYIDANSPTLSREG